MANEAELVVQLELPVNMAVANGTGIEKGAILKLTNPMSAILADGADNVAAGIAATEKIANDGVTRLGVFRRGWFRMSLSGACTVGDPLATQSGSANFVKVPTAGLSGAKIIGYAMQSGTTGDRILVELNIHSVIHGTQG